MTFENTPSRWKKLLFNPNETTHKYVRGHTVIVAGSMAGAAKLAARANRRAGSGLTTIVCDEHQKAAFEADWPGHIIDVVDADNRFSKQLIDNRKNTFLIGCGGGDDASLRGIILSTLDLGLEKNVVIDADGLTLFGENNEEFVEKLHKNCVLTPHEGEFNRLFPDLVDAADSTRVLAAAQRTGCTVVLKGHKTLIASPKGELVENSHTTAWLATAGTGDVLAGIIAGFMAQGMPAFEAAQAGVWVHGDAAKRFGGAGMIAEDVIDMLPETLQKLIS